MVHELGITAAWLIAAICLTLLSRQGYSVIKQRRRFSLRDMFIVLTLIAAIAGAIVGIANEDKLGISKFSLSDEIDRLHDTAHQAVK